MHTEKFLSIEQIERFLSRDLRIQKEKRGIELKFNLQEYSKDTIDKIFQCVKKYKECNFEPIVSISADELKLKSNDLENLIELEYELGQSFVSLYLTEEDDKYSLEQTIDAYLKCKEFADSIKNLDATPFEKYLMIYRFVTDRVYKESEEGLGKSRNLISILNGDDIVCVGYAKLLKYLCNSVGIQCETQVMDVIQNGSKTPGRHQNNIVYLKDDKYGIDGYYYVDACWDSVNKGGVPFLKYTYALVPFEDVKKMKGARMNFDSTNFLYKEYAEEDFIVDADRLVLYSRLMGVPMESAQIRRDDEGVREYFERLSPYMTKILEMLKENQIPADVLSSEKFEKIPKKFYPEFLLAMAVLDPPRLDIIKRTIAEMKKFYESNGKLDKHIEDLKVYATYGYEDIYGRLQETEYIDDIFNVWEFEKYYEIFQNLPTLWLDIERKKSSSKPIDKKTFASALYESFCLQGMSRENAKKATDVAMRVTAVITREKFKPDASLCFSKEDSELIEFGE